MIQRKTEKDKGGQRFNYKGRLRNAKEDKGYKGGLRRTKEY